MDTQKKTIILSTITATIGLLLLIAATGGKKSGSVWSFFTNSPKITRADFMSGPKNKYSVVRHDNNESSEAQNIYTNDYKPSTTFARAYVEEESAKHPLVASTKVIRKKDKLKDAKKRSKTLAKNKKTKSGSSATSDLEDDDFYADSDETTTSVGGAIVAGAVGSAKPQQETEEQDEEAQLNTVEYWEQPIFVEEDFNAVMKLVNSYNVKKVSNSVFYNVVDDMTHDERVNLREFGVFALAATPSSQSFSELAVLKHVDVNADIRGSVGQEISRYTNASRVNHVLSALRASNEREPRIAMEAMAALSETSRRYFSLGGYDGPNPQRSDSTTLLSLEPRLDSAVQLIQQKYGNSSNAQIRSEAEKTIAAISTNISLQ